MKEYVLDANVVFSAIISGKPIYHEILSRERFFVPETLFDEMKEYEELLIKKTKIRPEGLKEFTILLFEKLTVVPRFLVTDGNILKAYELCRDVDEKDTFYVALALELNIPLVTRDKMLYDGLRAKGFDLVVMFDEFFRE